MLDIKQLKKRYKASISRKQNWVTTYREALTYTAPHKENFNASPTDEGLAKNRTDVVFDSAGQVAYQRFINNIQAAVFPPGKKWMRLRAGNSIPENRRDKINKELEKVEDIFWGALHNSNFDTEMSEMLGDLGVGTGSIKFDKGTKANPFVFQCAPMEQIFLEENYQGRATNPFRVFDLPVEEIERMWPDAKLTDELKQQLEADPQKKVKIVDYNRYVSPLKYEYYVFLEKGNGGILVTREQKSCPIITGRWSVVSGEIYGRGVLMFSLPDIKTVNKVKEFVLKNASKSVAGVYTVVDDGIINFDNILIQPGARIPVTSNPGSPLGPSIAPLPDASKFDVAQLVIQDIKKNIDEITLGNPMGDVDLPVKSATEIAYRNQQMAKQIGSAYGRLRYEVAVPIINRGLFILEDLGMIDLGDARVDGGMLDIQFVAPIARAQDAEELTNIQQWLAMLAGIFGPQATMLLTNPAEIVTRSGNLLNIPDSMVPTGPELDDKMKQLMAAVQQISATSQVQPGPAQ